MSAYWITFSCLPTCLREERGMGLVKSGLWILVIVEGELFGDLTFGWVSDRIGRRRAFTLYASLMGARLAGIALAAAFSFAAAAWIWTLPETRGRVITAES